MKYLLLLLMIGLTAESVYSQSISVSAVNEHAGFSQSEFPLKSGSLSFSASQISFGDIQLVRPSAWSVSPQGEKVGVLKPDINLNIQLLEYSGATLAEKELDFFDRADETLAIYQFDDGRAVVRDNVANFTFFGPDADLIYSVSNSSRSPDGERESELATDRAGKTIVLYNPVISYGATSGSRARVVYGEGDHTIFFRDDSKRITQLKVSPDGAFISILASDGRSDKAYLFDRFGNKLFESELDQGQAGLTVSKGGEFITAYSRGRVQAFNVLTGERVGSSTSRNPVFYASYIPEDEIILVLGGNLNGDLITEPMASAIHVSKRQIAREEIGFSLSVLNTGNIDIHREQSNRYRVSGLNRELNISTNF